MLGKVHLDRLSVFHLEWYYAEIGKTLLPQTVKNHRT
jgi:hypothetical protein